MTDRTYLPGIIFSFSLLLFFACGEKRKHDANPANFTKADSLTETYLALQDSMLRAWNIMINDDNQKIEAMHNLLHELRVSGSPGQEELKEFEQRLEKLKAERYTQKTMANEDVVAEYDFASKSLVSELIAMAESQKQFAYNPTLQKLVDMIRTSDDRVAEYRETYDAITETYNEFVHENGEFLSESASDSFEAKPLFEMASDD
jgi:hypothetical protein